MDVKAERTIPADLGTVFDTWVNPKAEGSPFREHDELVFNPATNALWFWHVDGQHHYGRFLEVERPSRLRHTWVSRYSQGEESTVTVTFEQKGTETLVTLRHEGLPEGEMGEAHRGAWQRMLDELHDALASGRR